MKNELENLIKENKALRQQNIDLQVEAAAGRLGAHSPKNFVIETRDMRSVDEEGTVKLNIDGEQLDIETAAERMRGHKSYLNMFSENVKKTAGGTSNAPIDFNTASYSEFLAQRTPDKL